MSIKVETDVKTKRHRRIREAVGRRLCNVLAELNEVEMLTQPKKHQGGCSNIHPEKDN